MSKKTISVFAFVGFYALAAGLLTFTGCGGGTTPDAVRNDRDPKPEVAKTDAVAKTDEPKKAPKTGGVGEPYDAAKAVCVIKGVVSFEGKAQKMTAIPVSEAQCAAHHGDKGLKKEDLVVSDDNKVANVVVFVSEMNPSYNFDGYGERLPHALINQLGCQYLPHAFGMMTDQRLDIESSDPVAHNVHIVAKSNTEQNIAQGTKGIHATHPTFGSPEMGIKIKCDVHGWMSAWVCVFEHPFFAVTAPDGTFEIKVPPGTYTVDTWQELSPARKVVASPAQKNVTVTSDKPADLKFTYKMKP